jgi:hypothetical protein
MRGGRKPRGLRSVGNADEEENTARKHELADVSFTMAGSHVSTNVRVHNNSRVSYIITKVSWCSCLSCQ